MAVDVYTYPAQLPFPQEQGFGFDRGKTFSRTEMESGSKRQRKRFTSVPDMVNQSWLMSNDEFKLFEAWYDEYADSTWVKMPISSGEGLELAVECRFTSPYKAKKINHQRWQIAATLECRNRTKLDKNSLYTKIQTGEL